MWPFNRNKTKKQNYAGYQPTEDTLDRDNPPTDTGTPSEKQVITTPTNIKDVIVGIVLVNNRTDTPYEVKSINEYGLNIDARQKNPLIVIHQKNDVDGTKFKIAGIYRDFSITKINWETPTIINEEQ